MPCHFASRFRSRSRRSQSRSTGRKRYKRYISRSPVRKRQRSYRRRKSLGTLYGLYRIAEVSRSRRPSPRTSSRRSSRSYSRRRSYSRLHRSRSPYQYSLLRQLRPHHRRFKLRQRRRRYTSPIERLM